MSGFYFVSDQSLTEDRLSAYFPADRPREFELTAECCLLTAMVG
jgi:hypothetical protein